MNDYRIKQHDLNRSDAMQFQQHHEARTVRPVKEVLLSPVLLYDARQMLQAGDKITLCSYLEERNPETGHFKRLNELVNLRVVEVGPQGCDFISVGAIVDVAAENGAFRALKKKGEKAVKKAALKKEPDGARATSKAA